VEIIQLQVTDELIILNSEVLYYSILTHGIGRLIFSVKIGNVFLVAQATDGKILFSKTLNVPLLICGEGRFFDVMVLRGHDDRKSKY